MISEGYKKKMIDNTYKIQLLHKYDKNRKIFLNSIERIKIWLLFRKDDESLWVGCKFKDNTINRDIDWFSDYLTYSIYSIYQYSEYSENRKSYIQEHILDYIKNIKETKQNIDKYKDYAKYLEDIYD